MTKTDLIISDEGDIVLVQNIPFEGEVTRVEFYLETRYLMVVDENEDSRMIPYEITDETVINSLKQAATIILTYVEGDTPQGGFEVPFITISP